MQAKELHIITHDVPWPADFGGVVDLFYKIKSLHQAGIGIHLHCFVNKRGPQSELDKYCLTVNYYERQTGLKGFSFHLPYIVSSRRSEKLLDRLREDDHPVLIEGIHCSHLLYSGKLKNRKVLLRLHNAEFEYYHHLAAHEKHPLKKLYFSRESRLLKQYESAIARQSAIFTVSSQDTELYKKTFGAGNIKFLPVFIPYTSAMGKEGNGCFCLYHGNLSINENEEAVVWLLDEVFSKIEIPFVIAGKNPSQKLEFLAHKYQHTCLVANPGDKELHDLIAKAQINILPSFNNTGVKLKLLNALYNGRHCLVNKSGVEGSSLENICHIAEGAEGFREAITELYKTPFSAEENDLRNKVLQQVYNNERNAKTIMDHFWG